MGLREETEQKVFAYIEGHHMIVPGGRVVAGVSGGADSLCLFFLLLEYAKKVPFTLAAVHVNHGIRPDAGEDAGYVEELCRQKGIPCFLVSADVAGLARKQGISLEDAGRRVRYQAFYQTAEGMGGGRIAVAHNLNDNAETMLFHLFRGSGLKGLCGIAPVRGEVIRPVLCLERGEIEAYLKEREISWRSDSTNEEDEYSRNRIRHHILPYAEQEMVRGTVRHMGGTAEILAETEEYLEQQTAEALGKCLAEPGRADSQALNIEIFQSFHPALRKRMLHKLIKQLSPTGKDIHQVHIRDVLALLAQKGNRSVSLPFGIIARRQYDILVLERKCAPERKESGKGADAGGRETIPEAEDAASRMPETVSRGNVLWRSYPAEVPSWGDISENSFVYDLGNQGKLEFSAFFIKKWMEVPKNQYTKWFDYDKIEESLVIRSRRTGDYLTIRSGNGNMAHKSLKDYMVTEKIPRPLREEIPVVAAGNHVLWLAGWRISEYFKVDGGTKRILQIRLLQEKGGAGCADSETEEKNVRTHQGTFAGGRAECKDSGDRPADQ